MSMLEVDITKLKIPNHLAIIPDGNRRWAKERNLPPLMGHKKGAENIEGLLRVCKDLGIKYYTTWVFSTENWKREKEEVEWLFDIFRDFSKTHRKKFIEEKVRFIHLGRKDRIPEDLAKILAEMEEETKDFTEFTFALGLDYGGHDELIRTVKKIQEQGLEINKENIENNLDTKNMPMPDLIIRTSGEKRLSGFMSWQNAYAEFYFSEVHYPDLNKDELIKAIEDYTKRDRRFGGNTK